jgi:monofunctional biosynthetic peptidoglycan transglycosylase
MRRSRVVHRLLAVILAVGVALPVVAIGVARWLAPPVTPFMLARAVFGGATMEHRWIGLRSMSPALVRAVIAAEDARFLQHHGFDWTEVESALRHNQQGRRLRGASTISMQCARTLFLWPGRSVLRKAVEAYLTVLLELLWTKARILEVYLNFVEWGDGIYGCEAAARHAFGVSCAALDPEQAARLAAVLPLPRHWSARQPSRSVRRRASVILQRMPQVAVPAR